MFKPGQSGNPNGRPVGAIAKRTQALREKARKLGCDPVEVMILEIRDLLQEAKNCRPADPTDPATVLAASQARRALRTQAVEVAAKLAPYLHPRLANIELSGDEERPVRVTIDAARDRVLGAVLGLAAASRAGIDSEEDPRPVN